MVRRGAPGPPEWMAVSSVSIAAAVAVEGVDAADPGDVGVRHDGDVVRDPDVEVPHVARDLDLAAVETLGVADLGQVDDELADVDRVAALHLCG